MILILTNKDDVTVDFVVKKLKAQNIEYYRLNTEDIPSSIEVDFSVHQNKFFLYDKNKNLNVDLSKVESVYFRRAEVATFNHLLDINTQERNYLRYEMTYVLEGIYKVLQDKYWLNNIYNIREAENKIYQLQIAKIVGFTIPPSIISNSMSTVNGLIGQCNGDCIIKPIKTGNMKDEKHPKIIFTSKIEDSFVTDSGRVESFPMFIQKNIHKRYDLRCIVVGNEVFSAQIESQHDEDAIIDWRRAKGYLIHKEHNLPLEITKRCIEITQRLGLNYSAIDLILDKNDNYIFLECNPNGQWAWLEKRIGFQISNSIVELLIKKGVNNGNR